MDYEQKARWLWGHLPQPTWVVPMIVCPGYKRSFESEVLRRSVSYHSESGTIRWIYSTECKITPRMRGHRRLHHCV